MLQAILSKIKKLNRSDSLLGQGIRAGSILTIGSGLDNGLRFLRNIILARLLAPDDFGLMATVLAMVAFQEAFAEVGLRQSVIQNKRGAENGFLNTVWWFSSIRGIGLYFIAFVAAPFVSEFYQKPQALDLLRVGCLVFVFNGLISPRVHVLEKELKLKRWVFIIQGSGIAGVIVGIFLAFFLHNVWALLIAYVLESFLKLIFSFVLCPFKPGFQFHSVYTKEIISFSQKMFGLPILMMLVVQSDIFVIGKVSSVSLLGMYSLARGLSEMPVSLVTRIVHPITLASFSKMQDDKNRLCTSLSSITKIIATFGLPILFFLMLFSDKILYFAYGPAYAQVAMAFSILCAYSFFLVCSSLIMQIYISIGRPDIHRSASIIRTVILITIIYPATLSFGLVGASSSLLLSYLFMFAAQMIYLKRILNINVQRYFKTWFFGLKLSCIVIIPSVCLKLFYHLPDAVSLILGVMLCITALTIGGLRVNLVEEYQRA